MSAQACGCEGRFKPCKAHRCRWIRTAKTPQANRRCTLRAYFEGFCTMHYRRALARPAQ